ncbi:MAG: TonB-dependent receptor [Bacteroidota bacterium]
MKLSFLFLITGILQLSAAGYSQSKMLNIELEDTSVITVLQSIKEQSDFTFVYNVDDVEALGKVSCNFQGAPVEEILDHCLLGTEMTYEVRDRVIIIVPRDAQPVSEAANLQEQPVQEKRISGQVTNRVGEPLPGVTVMIKGTTFGTITDAEGNFSMTVEENAVLVFSFIGMNTLEIPMAGKIRFDVQLEEALTDLDEVVVVGYGAMKRRDLTGSIASVKAQKIQETSTPTLEKALQGRVAGVQVFSSGNDNPEGAGITIRIRGASSLNASKSPMLVVDGFPMGDAGMINSINPNNIKSIDVLKDASSTAIYGARGANGVILVTTKDGRGTGEHSHVYVNAKTSVSAFTGKLDYWRDPVLMAKLQNEAYINQGLDPIYIGKEDNLGTYYPSIQELESGAWPHHTNWPDYVLRTPLIHDYNIGMESANEKSSFIANMGYYHGEGMQVKDDYDKYTGDISVNYDLSDKLKVLAKAGFLFSDRTLNYGLNYGRNPIFPVYNDDDTYFKAHSRDYGNPVALTNERTRFNRDNQQYLHTRVDWEMLPGLVYTAQLSYRHRTDSWTQYNPTVFTYDGDVNNGVGRMGTTDANHFVGDTYLTYKKNIGIRHKIHFMAGGSYDQYSSWNMFIEGQDFLNQVLREEQLSSAATRYISNGHSAPRMASSMGRFNYTLDDKYLLTFTARADGSSKFGENRKWGFFPSVAAAWRLSEEEFIPSRGLFNDLKLRASYGITGNQGGIPSGMMYDQFGSSYYWSNGREYTIHGIGREVERTAFAKWGGWGNADIAWEQTAQTDVGIDMSMFDYRLSATIDLYYKRTTDLLRKQFLPLNTGFDQIWINDGEVINRGVELTVSGDMVRNSAFTFSGDLIFMLNRNKVIDIGSQSGSGYMVDDFGNRFTPYSNEIFMRQMVNVLAIDEPMNVFYGYRVDGIIQDRYDPDNENIQPGEYNYLDLNKDGVFNSDDRTLIGDPNPDFSASLNLTLTHKSGLAFSALLYGVYGNDIISIRKLESPALQEGRWTYDNPNNERPSLRAGRQYLLSNWFIQDGSFLRIQNLNLSYTLNSKLLKQRIKQMKVYLNVSDLYTFHNTDEYDPELGEDGYGSAAFPRIATYTFGLNIKF